VFINFLLAAPCNGWHLLTFWSKCSKISDQQAEALPVTDSEEL
jgi:hypothetical protein